MEGTASEATEAPGQPHPQASAENRAAAGV